MGTICSKQSTVIEESSKRKNASPVQTSSNSNSAEKKRSEADRAETSVPESNNNATSKAANVSNGSSLNPNESTRESDMEKEVNVMLKSEEKRLMTRARPLLNRRASIELISHAIDAFKTKEQISASKIQRCVRRMLAIKRQRAKQNWLVDFNSYLIDTYHGRSIIFQIFSNAEMSQESADIVKSKDLPRRFSRDLSVGKALDLSFSDSDVGIPAKLDSDVQDSSNINYDSYQLPKLGQITPKIAGEIVQVYKNSGKLHLETVRKLLRLAYRKIKFLPNISRVWISKTDKLTVVGDLHGKLMLHEFVSDCMSEGISYSKRDQEIPYSIIVLTYPIFRATG